MLRFAKRTFLILICFLSVPVSAEHTPASAPPNSQKSDCELFPIGQIKVASTTSGSYKQASLSNDGSRLISFSLYGPNTTVVDVASGKVLTTIDAGESRMVKAGAISPDGNWVLSGGYDKKLSLYEASSGKLAWSQNYSDTVQAVKFSPRGDIIAGGAERELKVFDFKTKRLKIAELVESEVNHLSFSPNGKYLFVATGKKALVYDLESDKKVLTLDSTKYSWGGFTSDNRSLLLISKDGSSSRLSISSEVTTPSLRLPADWEANATSLNDKWLATYDYKEKTIQLWDFSTGKLIKTFPQNQEVYTLNVSSDGRMLAHVGDYSGHNNTIEVIQIPSGKKIYSLSSSLGGRKIEFAPQGKLLISGSSSSPPFVLDTKITCLTIPLLKDDTETKPLLTTEIEKACKKAFDSEQWEAVAPHKIFKTEIARSLAEAYLWRFQKPEGFDAAEHSGLLDAILNDNKLLQKHPGLILGALESALVASPLLYQTLVQRHPKVLGLENSETKNPCRVVKEQEKTQVAVESYLRLIRASKPGKSSFSDWNTLLPLKQALSSLTKAQIEEHIDALTESLADGAADDPRFKGIFHSKLYYFAKEGLKPVFGQKQRELTDLTLVREASMLKPVILGVHPIDGGATSDKPFGFYIKELPPIKLPNSKEAKPGLLDIQGATRIAWTHGKETLTAELAVNVLPIRDQIKPSESPPYDELWKNGKLTGIVITGTNLKGIASGVMDEYLAYYQDQGFKFEGETQLIKDLHGFLKEKIESGDAGYLIKEAHSDGDEKNLFRLDKSAMERVGTRTLPDGKREIVHLIFPRPGENETRLLDNESFGTWIREREKKDRGSLVYFNTSCWSHTKALHEIEAAQSPKLINIPSITMVNCFSNDSSNAERLMLQAFRERKSYAKIREAMEKNDDFKYRKGNVLIFPDEADYDRHISEVLSVPLEIKLQIKDGRGKPFHIDEVR